METRGSDDSYVEITSPDGPAMKNPPELTDFAIDPEEEKRVMNKVSWRLLPFLSFLYLLSFLDRVNMGNVHASFLKDNGFDEDDYSNGVGIFFLGYVLFEIPSNLLLKKFPPSIWISRIMVTWGIASTCMMFVHTIPALLITRLILGIAEAGFFPGIVFYLTFWYTTSEMASRVALFFSSSAVAGFIGGVLAYFILQMDGVGGLKGWQWVFLLEGVPSIIAGVFVYFLLPNNPSDSKWLSEAEQNVVIQRIQNERLAALQKLPPTATSQTSLLSSSQENAAAVTPPHADKKISWDDFKATLKDPVVLAMAFGYFLVVMPFYCIAFFLTAIIGEFGFSPLISNLLSVPVYAVSLITTLLISFHSDRRKIRAPYLIFTGVVSCAAFIGLAVAMLSGTAVSKYLCTLIAASVLWASVPIFLAWLLTVLKSPTASATGTALVVSIGNIGGYVGPKIFAESLDRCGSYWCASVAMSVDVFLLVVVVIMIHFLLKFREANQATLKPVERTVTEHQKIVSAVTM
eukprot:TRINITY_DN15843_c0_g1_i1.p1 TRINITY_DN15843_c0_g1~~TRINITY_DN15843_c0_g1_i1.p1  ORF type:complete len:517 (-),score=100.51 TRINITY_DN15843_c0_g1_i1:94-1644(-)